MKRREFITLLGGAVISSHLTARAQQSGTLYRIGNLNPGAAAAVPPELRTGFVEALRELGWTEGKNVVFEYRYAENRPERCPSWQQSWCASRSISSWQWEH
jgi:putative tryptophan/tyrosine transport system substrate-binding protein